MEALIILLGLSVGALIASQFEKKPAPPPPPEKWDKEWEVEGKKRIKYRRLK